MYSTNVLISAYTWYVRLSAERDIKEAEKLMARYHTARMGSKGGMGSDKTPLVKRMSAAYNAYMVQTISYTAQDAAMRSHAIKAKEADKVTQSCIVIQMIINIILAVILGQTWKIPFTVMIAMATLITPVAKRGILTHIGSIIHAPSFMAVSLEISFAALTFVNVVPNSLRRVAGAIYVAVSAIMLMF